MKLAEIVMVVIALVAFVALMSIFEEKNPAYQPHPDTYYGRPAFVQLHRPEDDGTQYVTFYEAKNAGLNDDPIKGSRNWVIGDRICTVPDKLANSMYDANPDYPN